MSTRRHLYLIARRELLENLRTKGFWISVFVLPIVMAAISTVPVLMATTAEDIRFTVVDGSGWVFKKTYGNILERDLVALERYADAHPLQARAEWAVLNAGPADNPEILTRIAQRIAGLTLEGARLRKPDARLRKPGASLKTSDDSAAGDPTETFISWWFDNQSARRSVIPDAFTSQYQYIPLSTSSLENLNQHLKNAAIDAYFVIPEDPVQSADGATYVTENLTRTGLRNTLARAVTDLVRERRLLEERVPADLVKWIDQPLRFETRTLSDAGRAVDANIDDALEQWIPALFVYVLLISVLSVSQMLLTNTVEEKSNRLAELLLSSVTPTSLMLGKIFGVATTSLTMLLCWCILAGTALSVITSIAGPSLPLDLMGLLTNPVLIASFFVYFLLGYFFYAGVLIAIGSLCNTLKEAQNLAMPVQFLLFVPFAVIVPVVRDPNGWLAATLSWLPPFTPFVMMNRAADPPHFIVYLLTTALMIASIGYVIRFAGRVFEAGLLSTTRPHNVLRFLKSVFSRSGSRSEHGA